MDRKLPANQLPGQKQVWNVYARQLCLHVPAQELLEGSGTDRGNGTHPVYILLGKKQTEIPQACA